MTYKEKLLDPRWQKKRLEILQRDVFRCMCCGDDKKTLSVHHVKYENNNNPWEYENDDLITLCLDCHEEETKDKKQAISNLLKSLNKNGLWAGDIMSLINIIEETENHESMLCLSDIPYQIKRINKEIKKYTEKENSI